MSRKYIILLATTIAMIILSITWPANADVPSEPHSGNAMWIEPSSVDLRGKAVGYKFNITTWINLTSIDPGNEIGAWQFVIVYEKAYLKAARARYTEDTISQWFKDAGVTQTFPITPIFASFNTTHNYVQYGETWLSGPKAAEGTSGSLAWIELNVTAIPTEEFSGKFSFITTGTPRCKLQDEENHAVLDQFLLNESIFMIPEFTPLILITSLMITTCVSAVLATKIRKKKQTKPA